MGVLCLLSNCLASYLTAKYVSNYAQMPVHDLASQLILHLPNMPWLVGNLYLAVDAGLVVAGYSRAEAAQWA